MLLNLSERFTLRKRLLFLLLLASLPGMLAAVFLAINALSDQSEQIETSAQRLAAIQAAQHSNVIDNARIMLDTLVQTLRLREVEQAECRAFLENWVERHVSFTSLTLLDANGDIVCSNSETDMPYAIGDEDFFTRATEERGFVIGEYSVGRTGKPLIVAARPIIGNDDEIAGALAVGIDLRWLELLALRMDLPPGSSVTALSADGEVLNHFVADMDDGATAKTPGQSLPSEEVRRTLATAGSGVERGATADGSSRVYGFERTKAGGLVIAVGMPEFFEFERYGAALRDTLAAPIAIIVLALIAAAYASEALVTRWVRMLTGAATKMADGDLSVRSRVPHTRYEIGQLAAAFDSMAATIQREQQSLRRLVDQRQALLGELNHRVKNNLQMIVSLLSIQSRALSDTSAKTIFSDIIGRVRALSEIHNLLHAGGSDGIATEEFAVSLANRLSEFYESQQCKIEVAVEPVRLAATQAVQLGLIMNELITNACKHAFPEGSGLVMLELHSSAEQVVLSVSDNGVPWPGELEHNFDRESLGLRMVQSMANQMDGKIKLHQEGGWKTISLEFPVLGAGASELAQDSSGRHR